MNRGFGGFDRCSAPGKRPWLAMLVAGFLLVMASLGARGENGVESATDHTSPLLVIENVRLSTVNACCSCLIHITFDKSHSHK